MSNIETRVADTVLQQGVGIEVGGRNYHVAPPSVATLMRVSSLTSQLPSINKDANDDISETLRIAQDCGVLGDIFATIVLGARKPFRGLLAPIERLFWRVKYNRLSKDSLFEPPSKLSQVIADCLTEQMEVGFFLDITISLSETNIAKPTKTETTAPG